MQLSTIFLSNILSVSLHWLSDNYIELMATITGLIYLVLSVKGNVWLWFFGLITSALYIYVFFHKRIYADMGISVYYVIISIYGWYHWKYGKQKNQVDLPVSRVNIKQAIILFIISAIIFVLIAFVLKQFTNSDIAVWDAFTTAFSITATWMLARKIAEHWLVWIVVDLISTGLYIYKGLYPTVLLFTVYTVIAVVGYVEWMKIYRKQEQLA